MYYKTIEHINRLLTTKAFTTAYKKDIDDIDFNVLIEMLKDKDRIEGATASRLASLMTFCEADEALEKFNEYYHINSHKKWGNTLAEFQQKYGNREGARRSKELSSLRSEKNRKNGAFTTKHWTDKGYSIKAAKKRVYQIGQSGRSNRDYSNRTKTKIEITFWTDKGYSIREAEQLRQPYLNAITRSLDSLIEKYGPVEGKLRRDAGTEKRRKTIIEKYGSMSMISGQKGKASKMSLKVFNPILEYIKKMNYTVFIGIEGSKEYWIRDCYDNSKYYFLDFYIKELNIAIEYNGVQWHPKTKKNFSENGVLKEKYEELVKHDKQKVRSISHANIDLLVVWSDESLEDNISKVKNFINEHIPPN